MKRIVSGVQPTGALTIGNYLGAIKNFVKLQEEYPDAEFFFFVADLHSITIAQDRLELRKNIKEVAALYIACGLDPNKVNIFIQSEVPAHNRARITPVKKMWKKEQTSWRNKNISTYHPNNADILLYDADRVPLVKTKNNISN